MSNRRIVEFGTAVEHQWDGERYAPVWNGRVSVNLDRVAAAKTFVWGKRPGDEYTLVLMGSDTIWREVNAPYQGFMELWLDLVKT